MPLVLERYMLRGAENAGEIINLLITDGSEVIGKRSPWPHL